MFVCDVTRVDGHDDEIERFRQLSCACAEDAVEELERLAGVGTAAARRTARTPAP